MNKRIAAAVAMAGSLLLGPAALAAPAEPVSVPGYDLESLDGILDHGEGDQDDHGKDDDDHDHDGDGRPDHDPEDHDDDKPKDDDD